MGKRIDPPKEEAKKEQAISDNENLYLAIQEINSSQSKETLLAVYNTYSSLLKGDTKFMEALSSRKKQLGLK